MRLASDDDIALTADRLAQTERLCTGYHSEMLEHPFAGRSLRNYIILTERPELLRDLNLTEDERFWSRYYWMARFGREWPAVAGYDSGPEQQVFQVLSSAEQISVSYTPLPEVDAAVERDSVVR